MDMVCALNVRILVVDFDLSARAANLLKSKYEVVTATTGEVALQFLLKKHHGISLVVMDMNMPDMSSLELLERIETETRLPVVMMCDTFDEHLVMHVLLNGAMMFLMKPLCHNDIRNMWQFQLVKEREVNLESGQPPMSDVPEENYRAPVVGSPQFPPVISRRNPMILESSNGAQRYGKRKLDEMERGHGWSMGQTPASIWIADLRRGFLNIAQHSGVSNVSPSEVAHCINVPGVATNLAVNGLQQFHMFFGPQEKLQAQMIRPFATSAIAANPHFVIGYPIGQAPNNNHLQAPNNNHLQAPNNHGTIHREERESVLTRFMRDPHSREQLKIIIRGSLSRWSAQYGARSNNPVPPLASATVLQGPAVVPIGLAIAIETFIYANMNAAYAQPGEFMVPLPERMGNGEAGPSFLDVLDAESVLDAIIELLNE
ncbi:hypothetical protein KSS87_003463 [Heliosperma pusillum]|nr:hypothetical protein KSS87_003463 [Heliosperma pusillum]